MKTARWMMLGAMLGFVASSAVSCGGPTSKCSAQNCPFGCCDAAGSCQIGSSDAQCGSQGNACMACSFSQRCSLGQCSQIGSTGGGSAQGGGSGQGGGASGGGGGSMGGGGGSTGGGGGSLGGGGGTTGGGGGGSLGGGGGSLGGGGGSTGGGGGSTGGGGGSTGGGGGSTQCGPTNCSTCCSGNTCVQFPDNFQNTSCGLQGSACVNCASNGFVCSTTNATCVPSGSGGGGGATGGGGGSMGGGAGGGGGGQPIPIAGGESCATAVTLTAQGTYLSSTLGTTDDYSFTDIGNCQGSGGSLAVAGDVVFRIAVPNGSTLQVALTPDSGLDLVLNFFQSTASCSNTPTCLVGSDSDPEVAQWTNTTGSTVNVLVLIDGYATGEEGDFGLTYSLTP